MTSTIKNKYCTLGDYSFNNEFVDIELHNIRTNSYWCLKTNNHWQENDPDIYLLGKINRSLIKQILYISIYNYRQLLFSNDDEEAENIFKFKTYNKKHEYEKVFYIMECIIRNDDTADKPEDKKTKEQLLESFSSALEYIILNQDICNFIINFSTDEIVDKFVQFAKGSVVRRFRKLGKKICDLFLNENYNELVNFVFELNNSCINWQLHILGVVVNILTVQFCIKQDNRDKNNILVNLKKYTPSKEQMIKVMPIMIELDPLLQRIFSSMIQRFILSDIRTLIFYREVIKEFKFNIPQYIKDSFDIHALEIYIFNLIVKDKLLHQIYPSLVMKNKQSVTMGMDPKKVYDKWLNANAGLRNEVVNSLEKTLNISKELILQIVPYIITLNSNGHERFRENIRYNIQLLKTRVDDANGIIVLNFILNYLDKIYEQILFPERNIWVCIHKSVYPDNGEVPPYEEPELNDNMKNMNLEHMDLKTRLRAPMTNQIKYEYNEQWKNSVILNSVQTTTSDPPSECECDNPKKRQPGKPCTVFNGNFYDNGTFSLQRLIMLGISDKEVCNAVINIFNSIEKNNDMLKKFDFKKIIKKHIYCK
ncbi:ankyrin repeat protein [Glossina pallidipes salivary gland hypertrophy virus]|uniref:Ankyrin repeat protein n=2 Tax=Glossina hytrovirus (isolate Glossina pallidipes/Ethiopia/Seibersdorf/-) TaxID=379529 RepID=A0A0Y0LT30_GHVS|nr:hypothetical protein SGHV086 [Glossina pallidipes salivary gland hypertrophy virus]ABQ08859.1 hypothetical protein SGHV086 [Glossina pallidipes salivary gland hypertrophy virus]AMB48698.1 ankyrin repeat protein [Glossina pallidipes salivary gland hypertrophy virus]